MSFVTSQWLGSFENFSAFESGASTLGGNFNLFTSCVPGDVVLIGITVQGGGGGAIISVGDSKGNVYTLLGNLDFGGHTLAVYGSQITLPLTQADILEYQTGGFFFSAAVGLVARRVTLSVAFTETNANTGGNPTPLLSGTPDATFGAAIFGFTASSGGFPSLFTPTAGWENSNLGFAETVNDGPPTSALAIAAGETFAKTAQTYAPSFGANATYGQIVVGLRPATISANMGAVERKDHTRLIGITQADKTPPTFGPFYFAYVDGDTVAFDPQVHNVMDEEIFDFEIKHDEGQIPTLHITIKNPRVGLLAPNRKAWAYLSYQPDPNEDPIPIFFGVLVGIPSDFFGELIKLQFNARSSDYIELKQAVAESLRDDVHYDPVFLDEAHRDDPDAVLEGWSSLYHVDRVTLDVSASDILEGEDGTITFDETQGIYDSVKMTLGEAPLQTVQVQAEVKWTQRCIGYIAGPSANISSYTGGSFKSDWPKNGANIGGGWKVESSFVNDVLDTEHARTFSTSHEWKNTDPDADDCSDATMSYSATYTSASGISVEGTGKRESQTGICDPYGFASLSATQPGVNIPCKVATSGTIALLWTLNCVWTLRYDAKRDFNEIVVMDVIANLQSTLASPTVDQNTELIKVTGSDVGLPVETADAWSDFAGKNVPIATLIFPNDPILPGGKSYQMALNTGIAGLAEPTFSDIPGTLTQDGDVVWASLGEQPPNTQPQWTNSTLVAAGEIMVIEPKAFNATDGDMQTTGASYFFLCTVGGTTNSTYTSFEYLPVAQTSDDGPAKPVPFSVILGPGDVAGSNLPGQGTGDGSGSGANIPGTGGSTTDGSVVWVNLGTNPPVLPIPIGGTMTNVTARCYFPTPRGQQSIQYLIYKARARLRLRSRAVKIEFDVPFDDALGLSCRKNATLFDPRIPGGAASGKIVSYTLSCDEQGKLIGKVEIGCCVGLANSVPTITGTPEYTATSGYMEQGYQRYDGGQFASEEEDIAYTPPRFQPFDDGLAFPLQSFPGTIKILHPIQDAQLVALLAQGGAPGLGNVPAVSNALQHPNGAGSQQTLLGGTSAVDWLEGGEGTFIIECDPVAAEILIQPVTNGPFNGAYYVTLTQLELPKGIDLGAPSSP